MLKYLFLHAALAAPTVTVSGISSGAYMAVQMHIAHSQTIDGAAAVAGGVYGCAQGSAVKAVRDCMKKDLNNDASEFVKIAQQLADRHAIDDLSGLDGDRVLIFSGDQDSIVDPSQASKLERFYQELLLGINIKKISHPLAGHGFPTAGHGIQCGEQQIPWINDCAYDLAGEILSHLMSPIQPPVAAHNDRLLAFYQRVRPGVGLDEIGYIYLPKACENKQGTCSIHVAFHGCQMGREYIGNQFALQAGYNNWAEANNIIVIYPQVKKTFLNPNGCWDWFGYSSHRYLERDGPQIRAIYQIIQAAISPNRSSNFNTTIPHNPIQ